ncbi:MAG: MFS transporter [Okeania sp. SIO3B5]|uniref:MFS transporter n=1 Tax=Okeania sp. SIO3B5 TaxID=2607811 RepID=UPI0013FFB89E|nr:MFS transporter [Okeania sp. SIO3B5]NEO54642.1 MFS transporter [Okeania sp. SIO3B5]
MLSQEETKKLHINIILCQCVGILPLIFLKNGFVLNYIQKFGIGDEVIILLLTFIPNIIVLAIKLPLAFLSDRKGIKKIGNISIWMQLLGFGILPLIYFIPDNSSFLFTLSIIIYSLGNSIFFSNWFSLISPLIDKKEVGGFFAILRISARITGLTLTFISSGLIVLYKSEYVYISILSLITFLLAIRFKYYSKIPELTKPNKDIGNIFISWRILRKNRSYIRFCKYYFCISFLTSSLPLFFNLFEKATLNLSESQIIMMGFVTQIGSIAGFWIGAQIVDYKSNQYLFRMSNATFFIIVTLFMFVKSIVNTPNIITVTILTFIMGLTISAFRIGAIAEPLKQIQEEQKSFGITLSLIMEPAGGTLSGLILSQYLKYWKDLNLTIGKLALSHYEIYIGAIAIVFLFINIFFRFQEDKI